MGFTVARRTVVALAAAVAMAGCGEAPISTTAPVPFSPPVPQQLAVTRSPLARTGVFLGDFDGRAFLVGADAHAAKSSILRIDSNGAETVSPFDTLTDLDTGGFRRYTNPVLPAGLARHGTRWVAVGVRMSWDGRTTTAVPVVWTSDDGVHFTRRMASGAAFAGTLVGLRSVTATDTGFAAVTDVAPGGVSDRARLVVVTSSDGVAWKRVGTISPTWSVDATSIASTHGLLVISGLELPCQADSSDRFHFTENASHQAHIWSSADGGKTWTDSPLMSAGVIDRPTPAPVKSAGCVARSPDIFGLEKAYADAPVTVSVGAGGAVLWSGTGDRVAFSTDMKTWTQATFPRALPTLNPDMHACCASDEKSIDQTITWVGTDAELVAVTVAINKNGSVVFDTGAVATKRVAVTGAVLLGGSGLRPLLASAPVTWGEPSRIVAGSIGGQPVFIATTDNVLAPHGGTSTSVLYRVTSS